MARLTAYGRRWVGGLAEIFRACDWKSSHGPADQPNLSKKAPRPEKGRESSVPSLDTTEAGELFRQLEEGYQDSTITTATTATTTTTPFHMTDTWYFYSEGRRISYTREDLQDAIRQAQ